MADWAVSEPMESDETRSPAAVPAPPAPRVVRPSDPELEQEFSRAMDEFERGDYVELTVEQLERCAATGESPWPDESRG